MIAVASSAWPLPQLLRALSRIRRLAFSASPYKFARSRRSVTTYAAHAGLRTRANDDRYLGIDDTIVQWISLQGFWSGSKHAFTEIDASHVVMLSHPDQVAAVMESGLAYDILAYDPKRRQLTLPCSALSLTADDED